MTTGLLIKTPAGYEPLLKDIQPRYIGGRGYVYEPEYFAESDPVTRYTEYQIRQMRESGRVCPMGQVTTLQYARAL